MVPRLRRRGRVSSGASKIDYDGGIGVTRGRLRDKVSVLQNRIWVGIERRREKLVY